MELRHLRYFVAVAEELHFGRAAERLKIAQPPLSQQIRQLEAELGVALLQRTSRRVALTAAGSAFLEGARETLTAAEEAIRRAQQAARGEKGRLVLGFVGSATYSVLPGALQAFRRRYPGVELVLREMPTARQVQALRTGRLDAGFLRPPVGEPGLALQPVLCEPLIVALPAAHPLAALAEIPVPELAGEPMILPPRHLGGMHDLIVRHCQRAGFSPHLVQEAVNMETITGLVAGEAVNMETITGLVAGGIGLALVPAAVGHLHRPGVVYRSLQNAPTMELALAWGAQDGNPVRSLFVDFVRENLAAFLLPAGPEPQG